MNFLALETLEQYIENKSNSQLFPLLANAYLENEQIEKAEHICRTGLTSYSNDADGYFVLANILLKKGNLIEAVKQLQNAIKFTPGHIKSHQLLLLIGKENLSLSEIDSSHKIIQNFESNICPVPQITSEYFNDNLQTQLDNPMNSDSFIDETKLEHEEPFLQNEPFFEEDSSQDFDLGLQEDKEDELDLSDFEMEGIKLETETESNENNDFSLDIAEPDNQTELIESDFPEINFESNFSESVDEKDEKIEENQFIPSILQDEIDVKMPITQNVGESDKHNLEDFSLDLNLAEFGSVDQDKITDEPASFIPNIEHSVDNELGELDINFNFSDEIKQQEEKDYTSNVPSSEAPEIESNLSIKPVSESFDTSILKDIENHDETPSVEKENKSEDIPEFKNKIKKNLDNNISAEDKDKINLNIPIPTLTFVEVLQNQKLYDQALEILDLLEKRSSDKEKIIRKKEEIIKLKSMENY